MLFGEATRRAETHATVGSITRELGSEDRPRPVRVNPGGTIGYRLVPRAASILPSQGSHRRPRMSTSLSSERLERINARLAGDAAAPLSTAPNALAVSVGEAAVLCRLSRSKLYGHLARGELRSIQIGGSRRILLTDLQAWLAEQPAR